MPYERGCIAKLGKSFCLVPEYGHGLTTPDINAPADLTDLGIWYILIVRIASSNSQPPAEGQLLSCQNFSLLFLRRSLFLRPPEVSAPRFTLKLVSSAYRMPCSTRSSSWCRSATCDNCGLPDCRAEGQFTIGRRISSTGAASSA